MVNFIKSKIKFFSFYEWILLLFPISLVAGSFWVNFFLILSSLIFIYELIKKNFYEQLKLNWIYFYIILSAEYWRNLSANAPFGRTL